VDVHDLVVRASETALWARHIARFAALALTTILEPKGYQSQSPNLRFVLGFKNKRLAAQTLPLITAELPEGAIAFIHPTILTDVTALDSCVSKVDGGLHKWRKLRTVGLVFFAYANLQSSGTSADLSPTSQLLAANNRHQTSGSQLNPVDATQILGRHALSERVAERPSVKTELPSTSRLPLPDNHHQTSGSNSKPTDPALGRLSSQLPTVKTELPLTNDHVHLIQLMLSPNERQLQSHYFGRSKDGDIVRCLSCGEDGHMSDKCPSRTCEHCGAVDDHFSAACKSVQKCTRCREKGHSSDACPSKLMRSNQADGLVCDRCHAKGHGEDKCPNIWRTYLPEKKTASGLKLASRILVSCYQCGSNRHWGDDCPMRPRHLLVNSDLFSQKYAAHFIKQSTTAAEVVDLTNDDDDDVQFVLQRERRQPPARSAGIQMSFMSNTEFQAVRQEQGTSGVDSYHPSNGYGGGTWRSAPPLPDEPPPVLLGAYPHANQSGPPGSYAPSAYSPSYTYDTYATTSNSGYRYQPASYYGPNR
jgi:hypothetical protein